MRDYKKEYREYHARPEQKKNRAARNLWNRRLKGRVPAGKEIDHRRPLASGGSNTRDNIRFRSVHANRGDKSHMKVAQQVNKEAPTERKERVRRNLLLGALGVGTVGGGAYFLKNRLKRGIPDIPDAAPKPSTAPATPITPQGPRPLHGILRDKEKAEAQVFELTEDNLADAGTYDIVRTLMSDQRAYGPDVQQLYNTLGNEGTQTILRSPTGNKMILLMRLDREQGLSPAGKAELRRVQEYLRQKYHIPLNMIKDASAMFYSHLEKSAAARDTVSGLPSSALAFTRYPSRIPDALDKQASLLGAGAMIGGNED